MVLAQQHRHAFSTPTPLLLNIYYSITIHPRLIQPRQISNQCQTTKIFHSTSVPQSSSNYPHTDQSTTGRPASSSFNNFLLMTMSLLTFETLGTTNFIIDQRPSVNSSFYKQPLFEASQQLTLPTSTISSIRLHFGGYF